jgi:hypothetical protein
MQVRPFAPVATTVGASNTHAVANTARGIGGGPEVRKNADPWRSDDQPCAPEVARLPQAMRVQTICTPLNPDARPETTAQATSPNGLYELPYAVPVPKGGLHSLTFPISINRAEQRKGPGDAENFFGMRWSVNDLHGRWIGGGHIGLQPRPDGKARLVFSGFGPHFSPVDGSPPAHGGPGASSGATIDFQFGHKYELTVERDSRDPRLLRAFVQDVSTAFQPGPRRHVQDLRVDQDAVLGGRQAGFIEHDGKAISKSSEIGRAECVFHAPSGRSSRGQRVDGTLAQGELSGRFGNSTTGRREVAMLVNQVVAVRISLRGAR